MSPGVIKAMREEQLAATDFLRFQRLIYRGNGMVRCRLGGSIVEADSKAACREMGGEPVADPPPPSPGGSGACGTSSLMISSFNRIVLIIGTVDAMDEKTILNLDLPAKPASARKRPVKLTDELRKSLPLRAMRSIMKLTATYNAASGFQERISHKTERGLYLQKQWDHYFPEIYRITSDDFTLLNQLCSAWLRLAGTAKTMVGLADGKKVTAKEQKQKISQAAIEDAQGVLRKYGEASEVPGFKRLVDELISELGEYSELTAAEALDKFRTAPTLGSA
jgi:hypothetical protein